MADGIGVDTSSYPRPGPPVNPLDQIMKTGQAADVMGNIAVGQGVQQAIQPDGTIDRNVLAQVLKGSVAGSMKATEALTAQEHLRNAGYTADAQGLMNFNTRLEHIGKAAAYIMDNPTKDGIMKGFGYLANPNNGAAKVGLGIPQITEAMKEYYGPDGKPLPPDKITAIAQRQATQAQSAQEAVQLHLKHNPAFNTGARSGTTVSGSSMNPQGISMANEPPPTQGTVDTRRTLPDGTPNPNYGQPQIIGAGTSAPPPITRTDAAGRVTPPVRQATDNITGYQGMPSTVTSGGQPVRLAQPGDGTSLGRPGPMATGLPPGEVAPMTASGDVYAKALADSSSYAERMNPLKQAIPLIEKLGKSGTGPGQETVQHMKAFAQTFGIPTINQNTVKTYAELKKYLSQNAAAVAPPGTNIPSVLNAFEANPNVQQPQEAVAELSKMLYALGRMRQASVLAFKQTGLPSNQYTDWASKWSPQQDVRGYMADLMTPEARKELLSKVKKGSPAAARIAASYQTAKGLGLTGDVEGH